ncbi:MAG: ArgE/DapE family deacylase [Gemmatimonadota bacterium]|nr:MAG: ArgE/DapE family deacylase [Gemmatimonadota bacterium]
MDTISPDVLCDAAGGDALALARALVSTPSVNPVLEAGGAGEEAIARLTETWLRSWGFQVARTVVAPGRFNVVGSIGSGGDGRTLILNGHLDTVGVEGMTVPPFDAEVRDGRLWGRGACDMKGGVASILSASAALSRGEIPGRLIVALTCDEEHASLGMAGLVDSGIRADAAVVCEPTSLAVMPAHKGFVWVEAEFQGRAAHGSRPDEGVDAIEHAARYLVALDSLREEISARDPHPLLGHGSFHAGTIDGGSAPSVYPDRCKLVIERRTLPGESADDVMAEFQAVLTDLPWPGGEARITRRLTRPGTEVDIESELVRGLLGANEALGQTPNVGGMTAWVDAAFLNEAGVPAVCFGPGSIAKAHSADEWIETSEIEIAARVLEAFAGEFLKGDA